MIGFGQSVEQLTIEIRKDSTDASVRYQRAKLLLKDHHSIGQLQMAIDDLQQYQKLTDTYTAKVYEAQLWAYTTILLKPGQTNDTEFAKAALRVIAEAKKKLPDYKPSSSDLKLFESYQ